MIRWGFVIGGLVSIPVCIYINKRFLGNNDTDFYWGWGLGYAFCAILIGVA